MAVQGFDCHYGESVGSDSYSGQDTVLQCAAGCNSPGCKGFMVERRNGGSRHCVRKNSAMVYEENLENLQGNRVDQYMCYSGR